jgi:RecA-family ATPase
MSEDFQDHEPDAFEGSFVDVATAAIIPPTWIIKDLLPVGLTFVAAPAKSHKSGIVMAMSLIAAGYDCKVLPPYLSQKDHGGPTMYLSAEAEPGELRDMVENGMGVKMRADASILVACDPWAYRLDDEDGLTKLIRWLDGRKPRICIIDPLRDFHSLEEKDSGGMNRLLRPLRQWAVQNEAAIIIVHHTKKLDEERTLKADDMRGTTALFGIADGALMITPIDPDNGIVRMNARFKRAKGWEQTVRLAIYQNKDRKAGDVLAKNDEKVFRAYENGARTVEEAAKDAGIAKERALEAVELLVRNGYLVRNGKKIRVAK